MNRLSRYLVSSTRTSPCTTCGKKFRVGASVWKDYPDATDRRLCDSCVTAESQPTGGLL